MRKCKGNSVMSSETHVLWYYTRIKKSESRGSRCIPIIVYKKFITEIGTFKGLLLRRRDGYRQKDRIINTSWSKKKGV